MINLDPPQYTIEKHLSKLNLLNLEPGSVPISTYLTLPRNYNAKLIIPANISVNGCKNALQLYATLTFTQKLKKCIVILMSVIHKFLPTKYLIKTNKLPSPITLYEKVSTNFTQKSIVTSYSIRTGSNGRGVKIILQFLMTENTIVSYVKVGDKIHRGALLEREFKVLDYLNTSNKIFNYPKVLGFKKNKIITALELSPLLGYRNIEKKNYVQLFINYTEFVKSTRSNVSSLDLRTERKKLNKYIKSKILVSYILKHLNEIKCNLKIYSLSHRDMAGWNILINNLGEIAIIDWEFAKFNHNPFQDIFHLLIHTTINNSNASVIHTLKAVFKNKYNINLIKQYAESIGVKDAKLMYSALIYYLWDWYSLESINSDKYIQGKEYLQCLIWLQENENSHKYFI